MHKKVDPRPYKEPKTIPSTRANDTSRGGGFRRPLGGKERLRWFVLVRYGRIGDDFFPVQTSRSCYIQTWDEVNQPMLWSHSLRLRLLPQIERFTSALLPINAWAACINQ